jgi:crossover junction endodeoxyribonuclease RusA
MSRRAVSFEVIGIAAPKGSTKAFMPKGARFPVVTHDNPRTKSWQQLVADQAQRYHEVFFDGPVALTLWFYLPRPRSLPARCVHHIRKPDTSKLVRCAEDALTGILFRDDSQVVAIMAHKVYAAPGSAPRARIQVEDAAPPSLQEGALF